MDGGAGTMNAAAYKTKVYLVINVGVKAYLSPIGKNKT
jgi:hypothetical protein